MTEKLGDGRLIWIDLEMTGLDTDHDHILEIATIVTDAELNILAEGPEYIRNSFTKVQPRDYAKMMKAMVEAEERGLDDNETTELLMEVSHG